MARSPNHWKPFQPPGARLHIPWKHLFNRSAQSHTPWKHFLPQRIWFCNHQKLLCQQSARSCNHWPLSFPPMVQVLHSTGKLLPAIGQDSHSLEKTSPTRRPGSTIHGNILAIHRTNSAVTWQHFTRIRFGSVTNQTTFSSKKRTLKGRRPGFQTNRFIFLHRRFGRFIAPTFQTIVSDPQILSAKPPGIT